MAQEGPNQFISGPPESKVSPLSPRQTLQELGTNCNVNDEGPSGKNGI